MYKSTFTIFLSFCFLMTFAQQPLSVTVEKMYFNQNDYTPYKQANFAYNKNGKLKSEQVLKWNDKQALWENLSHWKKENPSEQNKKGMTVQYRTTKGKMHTTNATIKNTYMFQFSEIFFEKYNSVYTRRPDGQIKTVSYDRCRSNVKVTFKYNYDGTLKSFLKEETHQYGEITSYKGLFNYPAKVMAPKVDYAHIQSMDVEIFPNPSTGLINVKLDHETIKNTLDKVAIHVESLGGKRLKTVNAFNNFSTIPVDLSDYPAGMYIIKTESGTQQNLQKVFITK